MSPVVFKTVLECCLNAVVNQWLRYSGRVFILEDSGGEVGGPVRGVTLFRVSGGGGCGHIALVSACRAPVTIMPRGTDVCAE